MTTYTQSDHLYLRLRARHALRVVCKGKHTPKHEPAHIQGGSGVASAGARTWHRRPSRPFCPQAVSALESTSFCVDTSECSPAPRSRSMPCRSRQASVL
eukprot:6179414-Pleurochrysis_carterae.AAC.3